MSGKSFFDVHSEPLERRIATALAKVGTALKHQSLQNAGERGLSPLQAQILVQLHLSGGERPSDLADRLAVRLPTISDSVRVLVDKGLVDRQRDADDARATRLVLTEAGRTEARRAAGFSDFLASAVEAMSAPEQEVFLNGMLKMIRTLEERGQIPLSSMCVSCTHFRPNAHPREDRPHHCAFVDAPLGARHLRLECHEHEAAAAPQAAAQFLRFSRP